MGHLPAQAARLPSAALFPPKHQKERRIRLPHLRLKQWRFSSTFAMPKVITIRSVLLLAFLCELRGHFSRPQQLKARPPAADKKAVPPDAVSGRLGNVRQRRGAPRRTGERPPRPEGCLRLGGCPPACHPPSAARLAVRAVKRWAWASARLAIFFSPTPAMPPNKRVQRHQRRDTLADEVEKLEEIIAAGAPPPGTSSLGELSTHVCRCWC